MVENNYLLISSFNMFFYKKSSWPVVHKTALAACALKDDRGGHLNSCRDGSL